MPIFINEVTTEVPQPVAAETERQPVPERMPLSQPEQELLQTLTLIEERRARLLFD